MPNQGAVPSTFPHTQACGTLTGNSVKLPCPHLVFFRGRHGGVEKRGGRKTSRRTPLPKRGFGPPSSGTFFPPPSGVAPLFFLYKKPKLSTPEALWEGSEIFSGGCVVWYVFPPPLRFAPSLYHGPIFTCSLHLFLAGLIIDPGVLLMGPRGDFLMQPLSFCNTLVGGERGDTTGFGGIAAAGAGGGRSTLELPPGGSSA